MQDMNQLQQDLTFAWASAYGVPQQNVNVTLQNAVPNGLDPLNRPVTRVLYTVQVPGKNETPEILQMFDALLAQSPIAPIMVQLPPAPETSSTAHTLQIAVRNATEMDALLGGVRESWTNALGTKLPQKRLVKDLITMRKRNIFSAA